MESETIQSLHIDRFHLKHNFCLFLHIQAQWGSKNSNLRRVPSSSRHTELRGNGTLNPRRVSATLYPLSIPAIKLNGHTNHIANVFMKPEPQRSVEIAESISEIAHWHAPLSLPARWSSLIQNASNIQKSPKTHDASSRNPLTGRHRRQLFVPCRRIIILSGRGTVECFLLFTANTWRFVNLTETAAEGDFTAKCF